MYKALIAKRMKAGKLFLIPLMCLITSLSASAEQFITIGTGGLTGVYYPAGGAICRLFNAGTEKHDMRCTVESTAGSIENLERLRKGKFTFVIAQSDWQTHALKGTGVFALNEPFDDLRAVFSVHFELFTVVARRDAQIEDFDDLVGKRVNVGNPGSGQRGTMQVLMNKLGWTMDDFAEATEMKASEQAAALCSGRIDAMIYVAGHPNTSIKEATTNCDSQVVNVTGAFVDDLIATKPYYSRAKIPKGMYPGTDVDIPAFGMKATLVTRADVPDEVVYEIVRSSFSNLDRFRELHPAFAHLTPETMFQDNVVPLHPGAARYYKEQGFMK